MSVFDIGIDKLVVVGVLIGLIAGPARLREWRRALPRFVGRAHALYQQGRQQVVDDLDELAPDWREYDPRQLDPRRILRELGEEATRSGSPVGRASSATSAGASPGEVAADDDRRDGADHTPEGVGDDVDGAAGATGKKDALEDLDQKRDDPGDSEQPPRVSAEKRRQENPEREEEHDVEAEVQRSRGRAGEEGVKDRVGTVCMTVEMIGPQEDDAEGDEIEDRHRRHDVSTTQRRTIGGHAPQ